MHNARTSSLSRLGALSLTALACNYGDLGTSALTQTAGSTTGGASDSSASATTSAGSGASTTASETSTSGGSGDTGEPLDPNIITHYFGQIPLLPGEDNAARCVSWTLDNQAPLYIQRVILANEGSFHHSNWLIVPEGEYAGPDGVWPCADRGFEEIAASSKNTTSVLFAQSTQSYAEEQELAPGAVIKIPAHYKIVATIHTLNLAPVAGDSGLWLSLELLHPSEVNAVVTPLSMKYEDLKIPPQARSRFTGNCDLSIPYGLIKFQPLALRLHYILPHYHYLGEYFDVQVIGGLLDGQSVFTSEGFHADHAGITFDPPIDLPGATGLRFSCGYDNYTDQEVGWGNGDGEMCVLLAMVESDAVMGATVSFGTLEVEEKDGIHYFEGACVGVALPKNDNQGMPTDAEKAGPLYKPPVDPADQGLPPVPKCVDADPAASPTIPATLTSVRDAIFAPSCSFASCHAKAAAGELDLTGADLHATLLKASHDDPDLHLVVPGDPDASWLYQLLARCEPETPGGQLHPHMPLNAPFLLDTGKIAGLRAWIEAGAKDD